MVIRGVGLLPGVGGEGAPLRGAGGVVGVEARADGSGTLADIEEAPDLPTARQAVPPTFRTHVVGLPDHRKRTVVLAQRLQGVAHELTRFETRPIDHRCEYIDVRRL